MVYTVRPGDNLTRIARSHGVPLRTLIRANPQIRNPDLIYPGQQLLIPGGLDPERSRSSTVGRSRRTTGFQTYPPGSPEQVALFEDAARMVGVPVEWARDPGLVNILQRESGGRVGVPNYTYGARARHRSRWADVHDELKQGRITARSSATGLGQLLLRNVDRYYPNGRAGIGVAKEEAAGMLAYIKDRYGHPSEAWALYGTRHEGY